MKFWSALLVASSTGLVDAFPSRAIRGLSDFGPEQLNTVLEAVEKLATDNRFLVNPLQPINVEGDHAFRPPQKGDQRGPCPALNALANHNYIPHNGVTSLVQVIAAITQVLGMGIELSTVLSLLGVVWTGNPISLNPSFSIGGGGPDNILGNVFGLVGDPRGLQSSHNLIEADSSMTRDDIYVTGNAWTMNMTLWRDIYDRADANGVITQDVLSETAHRRWRQSIETNPNFYYGPWSGWVIRNAPFYFVGRILANHSSEHPLGILTKDVFKSFFAVYDDGRGGLEYREGHEKIPNNWKRNVPGYGVIPLGVDLASLAAKHPELASVGGNTGTVNSFTGLDISNITGGVLNAATLTQGNNFICFSLEFVKTVLPQSFASILKTFEYPEKLVSSVFAPRLLSLNCPAWKDLTLGGSSLWDGIQNTFPGAKRSGFSL